MVKEADKTGKKSTSGFYKNLQNGIMESPNTIKPKRRFLTCSVSPRNLSR